MSTGQLDALDPMLGHMLSMNLSLATVTGNSMYLAPCLRLTVRQGVVLAEGLLAIVRRDMCDSADSSAGGSAV
jgi:hypothetical protein